MYIVNKYIYKITVIYNDSKLPKAFVLSVFIVYLCRNKNEIMSALRTENFIKRPKTGMKCKIYNKNGKSHFFGEVIGHSYLVRTRKSKDVKYKRQVLIVKKLGYQIDIFECDYIITNENIIIK